MHLVRDLMISKTKSGLPKQPHKESNLNDILISLAYTFYHTTFKKSMFPHEYKKGADKSAPFSKYFISKIMVF